MEELCKYPFESVDFLIAHQHTTKNNALEVIVDTNKILLTIFSSSPNLDRKSNP